MYSTWLQKEGQSNDTFQQLLPCYATLISKLYINHAPINSRIAATCRQRIHGQSSKISYNIIHLYRANMFVMAHTPHNHTTNKDRDSAIRSHVALSVRHRVSEHERATHITAFKKFPSHSVSCDPTRCCT